MNRILVLMIFLVGAVHCDGQTPPSTSPAPDAVIATVLEKKITTKDATRLNDIIFGTLLKKYADENNIVPTEAELNSLVMGLDESEKRHQSSLDSRKSVLTQELASTTLTEQQRKDKESSLQTIERSLKLMQQFRDQNVGREEQVKASGLRVAKQVVTKWKINQSLYAKYGGRVIFQQAGAEPMDAYRAFLKAEQTKGSFKILDAKSDDAFWEYFDVANTSVYSKEEADKMMNTFWWAKTDPASR